jgi:hypothetical protein
MNKKQRRQYSADHKALEQRLENKYVPGLRKILSKQIRSFISRYKRDPRGAIAWLNMQVYDTDITVQMQKMYQDAVVKFGNKYYRDAILASMLPIKKAAGFGFNDDWSFAIIDFLSHHLLERAVLPITSTTKKLIMDVLEEGQLNSWGVERIYQELRRVDELSAVRARRIIRTELGIAANFGQNLADEELDFETQTEWITAHDHRVRSGHRLMDGKIIETGEMFTVPVFKGKKQTGTEQMTGPGDPKASAGNVINCRCTRAPIPKRDAQGNLIEKQKRIIPQPIKL